MVLMKSISCLSSWSISVDEVAQSLTIKTTPLSAPLSIQHDFLNQQETTKLVNAMVYLSHSCTLWVVLLKSGWFASTYRCPVGLVAPLPSMLIGLCNVQKASRRTLSKVSSQRISNKCPLNEHKRTWRMSCTLLRICTRQRWNTNKQMNMSFLCAPTQKMRKL